MWKLSKYFMFGSSKGIEYLNRIIWTHNHRRGNYNKYTHKELDIYIYFVIYTCAYIYTYNKYLCIHIYIYICWVLIKLLRLYLTSPIWFQNKRKNVITVIEFHMKQYMCMYKIVIYLTLLSYAIWCEYLNQSPNWQTLLEIFRFTQRTRFLFPFELMGIGSQWQLFHWIMKQTKFISFVMKNKTAITFIFLWI